MKWKQKDLKCIIRITVCGYSGIKNLKQPIIKENLKNNKILKRKHKQPNSYRKSRLVHLY